MAVTPIEAIPEALRMPIPGIDRIECDVPGMHTEADVAYGALSTFTMAVHEAARLAEQGQMYVGHHVGAVALAWNEQARTVGRFAGLYGDNPATGMSIHAETVIGAKARDYGMKVLYLGVFAPMQPAGEQTSPYPCTDCRTMFDDPATAEFSPRTILLSGDCSETLMVGTLAELHGLYDPAVREHVSLGVINLPAVGDRTYENRLFTQLTPVWARVYPSHRAAQSLVRRRRH